MKRVREYIPMPRRCKNCQRYGHSIKKLQTNCLQYVSVAVGTVMTIMVLRHAGSHPYCLHCRAPHSPAHKGCSKFLMEKEILVIKTKEHLSFQEARARASLSFHQSSRSYASAATENSTISANNYTPKNVLCNNSTANDIPGNQSIPVLLSSENSNFINITAVTNETAHEPIKTLTDSTNILVSDTCDSSKQTSILATTSTAGNPLEVIKQNYDSQPQNNKRFRRENSDLPTEHSQKTKKKAKNFKTVEEDAPGRPAVPPPEPL